MHFYNDDERIEESVSFPWFNFQNVRKCYNNDNGTSKQHVRCSEQKMRHLPLLKTSDSVGEKNRQCRANFWGFISALFCWFAAGWEEFKMCENSGKRHMCVLLKAQEKDDPLMLTKAEILLKTIENWNQNVVCCCSKGTGVLFKKRLDYTGCESCVACLIFFVCSHPPPDTKAWKIRERETSGMRLFLLITL